MTQRFLLVCALFVTPLTGCTKAQPVKCDDKLATVTTPSKDVGASFKISCPASCTSVAVWGTDTYTSDSSLCGAAVHAGVVSPGGGSATVTVVKALPSYKGSARNGVTSMDWSTSWDKTAFTVK